MLRGDDTTSSEEEEEVVSRSSSNDSPGAPTTGSLTEQHLVLNPRLRSLYRAERESPGVVLEREGSSATESCGNYVPDLPPIVEEEATEGLAGIETERCGPRRSASLPTAILSARGEESDDDEVNEEIYFRGDVASGSADRLQQAWRGKSAEEDHVLDSDDEDAELLEEQAVLARAMRESKRGGGGGSCTKGLANHAGFDSVDVDFVGRFYGEEGAAGAEEVRGRPAREVAASETESDTSEQNLDRHTHAPPPADGRRPTGEHQANVEEMAPEDAFASLSPSMRVAFSETKSFFHGVSAFDPLGKERDSLRAAKKQTRENKEKLLLEKERERKYRIRHLKEEKETVKKYMRRKNDHRLRTRRPSTFGQQARNLGLDDRDSGWRGKDAAGPSHSEASAPRKSVNSALAASVRSSITTTDPVGRISRRLPRTSSAGAILRSQTGGWSYATSRRASVTLHSVLRARNVKPIDNSAEILKRNTVQEIRAINIKQQQRVLADRDLKQMLQQRKNATDSFLHCLGVHLRQYTNRKPNMVSAWRKFLDSSMRGVVARSKFIKLCHVINAPSAKQIWLAMAEHNRMTMLHFCPHEGALLFRLRHFLCSCFGNLYKFFRTVCKSSEVTAENFPFKDDVLANAPLIDEFWTEDDPYWEDDALYNDAAEADEVGNALRGVFSRTAVKPVMTEHQFLAALEVLAYPEDAQTAWDLLVSMDSSELHVDDLVWLELNWTRWDESKFSSSDASNAAKKKASEPGAAMQQVGSASQVIDLGKRSLEKRRMLDSMTSSNRWEKLRIVCGEDFTLMHQPNGAGGTAAGGGFGAQGATASGGANSLLSAQRAGITAQGDRISDVGSMEGIQFDSAGGTSLNGGKYYSDRTAKGRYQLLDRRLLIYLENYGGEASRSCVYSPDDHWGHELGRRKDASRFRIFDVQNPLKKFCRLHAAVTEFKQSILSHRMKNHVPSDTACFSKKKATALFHRAGVVASSEKVRARAKKESAIAFRHSLIRNFLTVDGLKMWRFHFDPADEGCVGQSLVMSFCRNLKFQGNRILLWEALSNGQHAQGRVVAEDIWPTQIRKLRKFRDAMLQLIPNHVELYHQLDEKNAANGFVSKAAFLDFGRRYLSFSEKDLSEFFRQCSAGEHSVRLSFEDVEYLLTGNWPLTQKEVVSPGFHLPDGSPPAQPWEERYWIGQNFNLGQMHKAESGQEGPGAELQEGGEIDDDDDLPDETTFLEMYNDVDEKIPLTRHDKLDYYAALSRKEYLGKTRPEQDPEGYVRRYVGMKYSRGQHYNRANMTGFAVGRLRALAARQAMREQLWSLGALQLRKMTCTHVLENGLAHAAQRREEYQAMYQSELNEDFEHRAARHQFSPQERKLVRLRSLAGKQLAHQAAEDKQQREQNLEREIANQESGSGTQATFRGSKLVLQVDETTKRKSRVAAAQANLQHLDRGVMKTTRTQHGILKKSFRPGEQDSHKKLQFSNVLQSSRLIPGGDGDGHRSSLSSGTDVIIESGHDPHVIAPRKTVRLNHLFSRAPAKAPAGDLGGPAPGLGETAGSAAASSAHGMHGPNSNANAHNAHRSSLAANWFSMHKRCLNEYSPGAKTTDILPAPDAETGMLATRAETLGLHHDAGALKSMAAVKKAMKSTVYTGHSQTAHKSASASHRHAANASRAKSQNRSVADPAGGGALSSSSAATTTMQGQPRGSAGLGGKKTSSGGEHSGGGTIGPEGFLESVVLEAGGRGGTMSWNKQYMSTKATNYFEAIPRGKEEAISSSDLDTL